MKKITSIIMLLACLAIGFSSCNDSDNGPQYDYAGGMGTIKSTLGAKTIVLDDYGVAQSINGLDGEWEDGDRFYADFYIIEKLTGDDTPYNCRIEFRRIVKSNKSLITVINSPEVEETLGNDPLFESESRPIFLSIGDNQLTVLHHYYGKEDRDHPVKLAYKPEEISADTVKMGLRHDAKGDTGEDKISNLISYDLLKLRGNQPSGKLVLSIKIPVIYDMGMEPEYVTKDITYTW